MIRCPFEFDGHLIVNASFETNIEYVYAAGPVAKFSAEIPLASLSHTSFDSVEIGARVADVLMALLRVRKNEKTNTIKFVRPRWVYCRLPGQYNYLYCTMPDSNDEGNYTIRSADNEEYFEIVINQNTEVMELICCSKRASIY